jgi:predicted transcriptional regulator
MGVKVKDIMKKHVVTIDPGVNMQTVSKILTNNRIGCAVITEKSKPIGVVTTNDIVSLVAENKNLKKILAGEFWRGRRKPFITISPSATIMEATKQMIKTGIKRIPVVDNGELKGIVSTKEILLVSPELIEILSEKLKAKVDSVAKPDEIISGLCESCDSYSDDLKNVNGRWMCPDCMDED